MALASESHGKSAERVIGRYAIFDEIASGGMAVVHLGRMIGQAGFSRTVAVKRLHPQFARDPNFVAMFLDEAKLAVRVQHPNVVAPLDVLVVDGEVLVVMEYVQGDTLSRLQRSLVAKETPPTPAIIVSILSNALYGLHAAHEAVSEDGQPLNIVHRDVSPQNIMVGSNGIARVLDFGIAKASLRSQNTTEGEIKGKLAYMAPEQVEAGTVDRRVDVFAAGVVAWESLTRRRLFCADEPGAMIAKILRGKIPLPSHYAPDVPPELDLAVLRALQRNPMDRYQTAREFATMLERACPPASPGAVGDWVKAVGGGELIERAARVAIIEARSSSTMIRPLKPPERVSRTMRLNLPVPPPTNSTENEVEKTLASRVTSPRVERTVEQEPIDRVVIPQYTPISETRPRTTWPSRVKRVGALAAVGTLLVVLGGVLTPLALRLLASTEPQSKGVLVPAEPSVAAPRVGEPSTPALFVATATAENHEGALAGGSVVSTPEPPQGTSEVEKSVSDSRRAAKKSVTRISANATVKSLKNATIPARSTKAVENCSPPYFVDAKGIRRLRPECS